MPPEKFCPVCKQKNSANATHCAYCNSPLESSAQEADTTARVAGTQPELLIQPGQHLQLLAELPPNTLVLFVMDNEEPIVIKEWVKVILGRDAGPTSIPLVDLTPYEAVKYGVSRQHAIVTDVVGSYTLHDLNSTNGTWLNGRRLDPQQSYPLSSGSQIRLGQLTLYAYFRQREAAEDILLLYEEAHGSTLLRPALTPAYLVEIVHPYLQALEAVQHALEDARGQSHSHVYINTIGASRRDSPIGVSLSGASEAVRVAKEWIAPWRRENADSLTGLIPGANSGEPTSKTDSLALTATRRIQEPILPRVSAETFSAEVQAAVQRLTANVLGQFLPNASELDQAKYVLALAPQLMVLATSRLQVYVETASKSSG